MKYFFLHLLLIFILQVSAQAQANKKHTLSISAGPELLGPEKRLRETHHIGYGISIKGEYTFGKHASITLSSAWQDIKGKTLLVNTVPVKQPEYALLSLRSGFRYYIGNFYLWGEGGIGLFSKGNDGSAAIYSAGAGDKIKIGRNKLDVSIRHEGWMIPGPNPNTIILRVAYEIIL